ncbi:hypothetical protein [Crucivirus-539]|nr:hypothetical protein [Crucivirus-539]
MFSACGANPNQWPITFHPNRTGGRLHPSAPPAHRQPSQPPNLPTSQPPNLPTSQPPNLPTSQPPNRAPPAPFRCEQALLRKLRTRFSACSLKLIYIYDWVVVGNTASSMRSVGSGA